MNKRPTNTPKKKFNLRLIIGIVSAVAIIISIVVILIIVGSIRKNESSNNKPSNTNSNVSTDNSSRKIKSADLDLYNNISNSNYLSVVLYDPLKDRSQTGDKANYDKPIIVTYDLGENVKSNFINNGFKLAAEESDSTSLKYYFAITNNKYIVYLAISTTTLKDGASWVGTITKEDGNLLYYKDDSRSNILTQNKNYKNEDGIYGTNWYTTNDQEAGTNQINLKLAETSDKDIYVSMQLNSFVNYDNSFVDTVNNMVKNNDFKNTLTILNNTDDLTSIINSYGRKVDLSQTIFYQDIVSTIIADEYGLNLKNKDFFAHTDTMYIKYRAYTDDDYLTEVIFEYPKGEYGYNHTKQDVAKDKFEYTYNGIKYSYFTDYQDVYVYKDEKFVGKIKITHRGRVPEDVFAEMSYLFGTRK